MYTLEPIDSALAKGNGFTHWICWNKRPVAWCRSEAAAKNLMEDLNHVTPEQEAIADRETGKN